MMTRRLFLSALGILLLPVRGNKAPELVIDYTSRDLKLSRTIAIVDGVDLYSVKRAWIVGDTLELEMYNIVWLTDASGRHQVEVESRQLRDGSRVPTISKKTALKWKLCTVDARGEVLSERCS